MDVEEGTQAAGVAERSSDPPGYSVASSLPWQPAPSEDKGNTELLHDQILGFIVLIYHGGAVLTVPDHRRGQ